MEDLFLAAIKGLTLKGIVLSVIVVAVQFTYFGYVKADIQKRDWGFRYLKRELFGFFLYLDQFRLIQI